jgi:hypothetical protein
MVASDSEEPEEGSRRFPETLATDCTARNLWGHNVDIKLGVACPYYSGCPVNAFGFNPGIFMFASVTKVIRTLEYLAVVNKNQWAKITVILCLWSQYFTDVILALKTCFVCPYYLWEGHICWLIVSTLLLITHTNVYRRISIHFTL